MRSKTKAQRTLEQVELAETIVRNKLIEKQQWMDIALGITASTGGDIVKSSGTQSKMADAINKCIDVEREIDEAIDRLIDVKKSAISLLEKLDNPTEYNILHMRYIQYMSLQEIADKCNKEYGWVTTTHGRALASADRLLDKVCDFL